MLNQSEIIKELDNIKSEIETSGELYEETIQFKGSVTGENNGYILGKDLEGMQIHYAFPLSPENKKANPLVVFIKRAIRKLNKFLLVPMIMEQNMYNERLCLEINMLKKELNSCKEQIVDLESRIRDLEK
ncbi:MAG: hypothetical protein IIX48_04820 [Lachnospiraceae bacterium]|nr:hypothetical protein [Lachnospiraceae bacterium]